jgi:hypothetical protein
MYFARSFNLFNVSNYQCISYCIKQVAYIYIVNMYVEQMGGIAIMYVLELLIKSVFD